MPFFDTFYLLCNEKNVSQKFSMFHMFNVKQFALSRLK